MEEKVFELTSLVQNSYSSPLSTQPYKEGIITHIK